MSDELLDQIHKEFGIDTEEFDGNPEEILEEIRESPEWDLQGEMKIASEIWGKRIEEEEETDELEHHKAKVDDMLSNIQGFQNSVEDLKQTIDDED